MALYDSFKAQASSNSIYDAVANPFSNLRYTSTQPRTASIDNISIPRRESPNRDLLSIAAADIETPSTKPPEQTVTTPSFPVFDIDTSPIAPSATISSDKPMKRAFSGFDRKRFTEETYAAESKNAGGYKAINPKSSATGKYQFLFNTWKNEIGKVTGVRSREEFRNSPEAQEKFFDYYLNRHLEPGVKKLAAEGQARGFDETQVGRLIHFLGQAGAKKALREGNFDEKIPNNLTINQYLRRSKGKET